MIEFFTLLLLVAGVVVNVVLWVQFPSPAYRRPILWWALGAPTACVALLYFLDPMVGLSLLIIVAGLCAAFAGPAIHVAFLRWSKSEGSRDSGGALAGLLLGVGVVVLLIVLVFAGVFSFT
jgi:hypothetical protein